MDEKVICVRMEPKFEAKSYVPTSIIPGDGSLEIVGGRKYRIESEEDTDAKLYFVKGWVSEHTPLPLTAQKHGHHTVVSAEAEKVPKLSPIYLSLVEALIDPLC